eukprot:1325240-Amorphochlora_amoeboformis.AAC.2
MDRPLKVQALRREWSVWDVESIWKWYDGLKDLWMNRTASLSCPAEERCSCAPDARWLASRTSPCCGRSRAHGRGTGGLRTLVRA